MKIGIRLKNREISEDIARRITELYSGVCISILKDYEETEDDIDIMIDSSSDFNMPVSAMLRYKLSEYEERTGRRLDIPKKYAAEIFFVTSKLGGSGVSSIAAVLGRLFAGKEGKRVLIAERGSADVIGCSEPAHKPERSRRELEFLIAKGKKVCFSKYYYRDRYGPFFITSGVSCDDIMRLTEESANFDIVIFSGFDYSEAPAGAKPIYVKSCKDRRSEGCAADEEAVNVLNRSADINSSDKVIRIPDDEDSFLWTGEGVTIKMDGEFSRGVDRLYKSLRGLI